MNESETGLHCFRSSLLFPQLAPQHDDPFVFVKQESCRGIFVQMMMQMPRLVTNVLERNVATLHSLARRMRLTYAPRTVLVLIFLQNAMKFMPILGLRMVKQNR